MGGVASMHRRLVLLVLVLLLLVLVQLLPLVLLMQVVMPLVLHPCCPWCSCGAGGAGPKQIHGFPRHTRCRQHRAGGGRGGGGGAGGTHVEGLEVADDALSGRRHHRALLTAPAAATAAAAAATTPECGVGALWLPLQHRVPLASERTVSEPTVPRRGATRAIRGGGGGRGGEV